MKIAIIGAAGRTGIRLVREARRRGHQVVAVCRTASAGSLKECTADAGCVVITAPVVSDAPTLVRALAGCDAVIAIVISVKDLKATELVRSLAGAAAATGVKRFVFTAGEMTAAPEPEDRPNLRQRVLLRLFTFLLRFTPYSLTDMIQASVLVRQQPGWDWTIMRAPTLSDGPATGYRFCRLDEVTSKQVLSREDYAASMLDSLKTPEYAGRTLTVVPVEGRA